MHLKKAQSASEFLILVGFAMFVFVFVLGIVQSNIGQKNKEQITLEVTEIALAIQNEIQIASDASNGYERTFTLQEKVSGKEYNATIIGNFLFVRTLDEKHALALKVQNVTGQIVIGDNKIKKSDSKVLLNQP